MKNGKTGVKICLLLVLILFGSCLFAYFIYLCICFVCLFVCFKRSREAFCFRSVEKLKSQIDTHLYLSFSYEIWIEAVKMKWLNAKSINATHCYRHIVDY